MSGDDSRAHGRVLDPVERVSEVIFGVLMALTFTGSLSVASPDQEVRTMLIAAFGCNLAWGLTDAAMYLIGTLTERQRKVALLRRLHAARDAAEGRRLIAQELAERIAQSADEGTLEGLRVRFLQSGVPEAGLGRRDWSGALGVFLLVVAATFPVVVPFLFIGETMLALRVSNGLALLTMFIGGTMLGRYAGGSPWRYGLALSAIGAVLVVIIIALGG